MNSQKALGPRMSFRFRLQSILRLRERDRDQAAQALEQAVRAKQILLDRIDEIENERQQLLQERGAASVGQVDIQHILTSQRYEASLIETVRGIEVNIGKIETAIDERRAKLVTCEQGVKVLEKLRDSQQETWNQEQAARRQSRLDEWASFQHFQKHSGS